MTEEEAKSALFKIHQEYMKHSPKERLKLYNEYREKRNQIKEALSSLVNKQKLELAKIK